MAPQPASPEPGDGSRSARPSDPPLAAEPAPAVDEDLGGLRDRTALKLASTGALVLLKVVALAVLVVLTTFGLLGAGLNVVPMLVAQPVATAEPPQPPPVLPPAVPLGARPDWAEWSYVQQINKVWGKDWPRVIAWFEEFDARYPGNPMVLDKLYAAYIEDGRRLAYEGDVAGARQRFEQAARFDPSRPEAADFLAELDQLQAGR